MNKSKVYYNTQTGKTSLKVRQEVLVKSEHLEFIVAHRLDYQPEYENKFNSRKVILQEFKSWILEHGYSGDTSFDIDRISFEQRDINVLISKAKVIVEKYFPELYINMLDEQQS